MIRLLNQYRTKNDLYEVNPIRSVLYLEKGDTLIIDCEPVKVQTTRIIDCRMLNFGSNQLTIDPCFNYIFIEATDLLNGIVKAEDYLLSTYKFNGVEIELLYSFYFTEKEMKKYINPNYIVDSIRNVVDDAKQIYDERYSYHYIKNCLDALYKFKEDLETEEEIKTFNWAVEEINSLL